MSTFDRYAYDAWVTRDPPCYEEPEPLHCSSCGRFLRIEPDFTREFCAVDWCDGKPSVYENEHDEAVLRIIGEEYRGKTYRVAYPPPCCSRDGKPESWHRHDHEIGPEEVEEWRHTPHFFESQWGSGWVQVRVCACGHANEEPVI